jgi:chitinase
VSFIKIKDFKKNLEFILDYMRQFTNLRNRFPETKYLFSVGGYTAGSTVFSNIARNPIARERFVNSVLNFVDRFNFDGMDLDWEVNFFR